MAVEMGFAFIIKYCYIYTNIIWLKFYVISFCIFYAFSSKICTHSLLSALCANRVRKFVVVIHAYPLTN